MASQMGVVANRRYTRNQVAETQAKLSLLPSIMAAKESDRQLAQQEKLNQAQIANMSAQQRLAQKQYKQEKKAGLMALGVQGAGLGYNIATSDLGKKTLGSIIPWGDKTQNPAATTALGTGGIPPQQPWYKTIPVGQIVGSGLVGFGAGRLLGGKSKVKRAGIGAMAGGLLSGLLSGPSGSGFNWGGAATGAVSGLLGGLF